MMKIVDKTSNLVKLGDVCVGQVFKRGNYFYIRTDMHNDEGSKAEKYWTILIVRLSDGKAVFEDRDKLVELVDAELVATLKMSESL